MALPAIVNTLNVLREVWCLSTLPIAVIIYKSLQRGRASWTPPPPLWVTTVAESSREQTTACQTTALLLTHSRDTALVSRLRIQKLATSTSFLLGC